MGLRPTHYPHLESQPPQTISWFEAISENYMETQGRPLEMLLHLRRDFPFALHGVGMNLGGNTAQNLESSIHYLKLLKRLIDQVEPFIVSDHLCWTTAHPQHQLHDLLPLPYTLEAVEQVCENIERAQDVLKRPLLVENVSTYLQFKHSSLSEWEFLNEVSRRTGCRLLLDLNNLTVNAFNHGFDPYRFLDQLHLPSVGQIHLAGHTDCGTHLFDTHSKPVCSQTWSLLEYVLPHLPSDIPLLLEWDEQIPPFEEVEKEAMKAKVIWEKLHEA